MGAAGLRGDKRRAQGVRRGRSQRRDHPHGTAGTPPQQDRRLMEYEDGGQRGTRRGKAPARAGMAGLVGLVRSPGPRRWCGMVRPSLAFAQRRQPRGARGEDPDRARRARRPDPGDCLAAKLPDADQTPPRAAGGRQGRMDTVEGPAPAGAEEGVDAVAGQAAWCGLAVGQGRGPAVRSSRRGRSLARPRSACPWWGRVHPGRG